VRALPLCEQSAAVQHLAGARCHEGQQFRWVVLIERDEVRRDRICRAGG
jgi:hypothetical protein